MKKVAISQSNYIPRKGYFDSIAAADEIVLYDDMQYTKRDWRTCNKIRASNGSERLSIPVQVKGKYFQKINETLVSDLDWLEKHWSEINLLFIQAICEHLGIVIKVLKSNDFTLAEGKTSRLVDLAKQLRATECYLGPAARNYLDEPMFDQAEVKVKWFNCSGYPECPQLTAAFLCARDITDQRLDSWCFYHQLFESLKVAGKCRRPIESKECSRNAHMYYLLLDLNIDRADVLSLLSALGVNAVFHYVPLHNSPAGQRFGRAHGDLSRAEKFSDSLIRLPLWVGISEQEQAYVYRASEKSLIGNFV